jgi:hypothetical protein
MARWSKKLPKSRNGAVAVRSAESRTANAGGGWTTASSGHAARSAEVNWR